MARVDVTDSTLVVTLTTVEKLGAARWAPLRSPLRSVASAEVVTGIDFQAIDELIDLGFTMATAPLRELGVVAFNGRARSGGRAAVLTRRRRPALVVRMDTDATWRLLIVSMPDVTLAHDIRERIERARPAA